MGSQWIGLLDTLRTYISSLENIARTWSNASYGFAKSEINNKGIMLWLMTTEKDFTLVETVHTHVITHTHVDYADHAYVYMCTCIVSLTHTHIYLCARN